MQTFQITVVTGQAEPAQAIRVTDREVFTVTEWAGSYISLQGKRGDKLTAKVVRKIRSLNSPQGYTRVYEAVSG